MALHGVQWELQSDQPPSTELSESESGDSSEELLHQQSNAIKNQLGHPKTKRNIETGRFFMVHITYKIAYN